jgi:mono/diheme cytochrome c family protein
VVSNSLRHLTDEDIGAIIEYLRTIKPVRAPVTAGAPVASPAAASLAHGKQVYEGVCANCHHIDGAGNQTRYEALNGSHSLRDPHANNLIQAVLYGSSMETPLGQVSMPGFAGGYTDSDLAAVINYATAELGGGRTGAVDAASVQRSRQAP